MSDYIASNLEKKNYYRHTVKLPRLANQHRDHSLHIEKTDMHHCQGIACTSSFDMSLTSAKCQKLES